MSNNFFRQRGKTFEEVMEYRSSLSKMESVEQVARLENYPLVLKDLLFDVETEAIEKAEVLPHPASTSAKTEASKESEIRMQEIEEFLTANFLMRVINGTLSIWSGNYYRQLNLAQFTEIARSLLPNERQKKISRFTRFKETYEYMLANANLKNQFSDNELQTAQYLIAFKNGFFDGRTGKLFKASPRYPVLFEINAEYCQGEVEAPVMDKVILDATDHDENALLLFYEMLGYIFSQGIQAKKFFVLATAPDSGKSIVGEFVARILGENNVATTSLNDFSNRFALGLINQKILNYNMDLPADCLNKVAVQKIKQLTGDPRIECEEKYVQAKTAVHHCKFLFASNHPIRLQNEDVAFWGRLILIPFVKSTKEEERDYSLANKLWKERNAIATKAALAYKELLARNFLFTKSEQAEKMLMEWHETSEETTYRAFFNTYCQRTSADAFVPTDTVFRHFQNYCRELGKSIEGKEKPIFSKRFAALLGLQITKRRYGEQKVPLNGYVGIEMKNDRI